MTNFKTTITCTFKGLLKSNLYKNNTHLNNSDITIYEIYLPDYFNIVNELYLFLNKEETDRAQKYYKIEDRNRYIICRALLKFVLSMYIEMDVKQIKFDYNTNKKPYLSLHPELFFNISHSNDFGLIAVSNRPIGIDIEYMEDNNDLIHSLNHIYNEKEIVFIENAFNKKQAFYSLWTRKEAFVKAIGTGIDEDFSKIPSIDGLHILESSLITNGKNWKIDGFKVKYDYVAAIAYEVQQPFTENISFLSLPNKINELT